MRIVIFGASGLTGRELVTQALALGHDVTAFSRHPHALARPDKRLRIEEGDITDAVAVGRAVEGQGAVLSALGAPTPMRPYPALQTGIDNVVRAMETSGVERLVYLSFLGVRAGGDHLGFFVNHVAARLLRHAIVDHAANERRIQMSRLAWTIVHAPKLTGGPRTAQYRSGEDIPVDAFIPTLSRADAADFMLRQLTDDGHIRRTLRVMY